MQILVTGGTGYIGSHTIVELLNQNYEVIAIDNLYNSQKEVIKNIQEITHKKLIFYEGDVIDTSLLRKIFKENKIKAVMHFAGYKAVGESTQNPLKYYKNNIESTISLCEIMSEYQVKKLIFSSSATVYGKEAKIPYQETSPITHATNPYGESKIMIEKILNDLYASDNTWSIAILRYFNPIGAHKSGLIGDSPNNIPTNLMPYILKVATSIYPKLYIYGDDYQTKDGTGVRDYIHVVDLALGHIKALEWILKENHLDTFNLGTGKGYSVKEVVESFQKYNHITIPYQIAPRREGDLPLYYADPTKAREILNWTSIYDLPDMVKDSYNYIKKKTKK